MYFERENSRVSTMLPFFLLVAVVDIARETEGTSAGECDDSTAPALAISQSQTRDIGGRTLSDAG
jgi:hypothetical protein